MAKSFINTFSPFVYARYWDDDKVNSSTHETGKLGAPEFCSLTRATAYMKRCAHQCLPHQRMDWRDIKSIQFIGKKSDRAKVEKVRQVFQAVSSKLGISIDSTLRYDKGVVDENKQPVLDESGEQVRVPLKDYWTGEPLCCFYVSDSLLSDEDMLELDEAFAEVSLAEADA